MHILCDIDGVICKYDFPELTKRYFGVEIPNTGIFTYSLEDSLGVPQVEVERMFRTEAFAPPNFIEGAVETLTEFLESGHTVSLWSAREHFMGFDGLCKWVSQYNLPRSFVVDDVIMPYDFHIDDNPRKLMSTDGRVKHKLLFDSPWNQQCLNITGKMIRVKNWDDVRRLVNEEASRAQDVPASHRRRTETARIQEQGLQK